jgi:hypothetical protein
MHLTTHIVRVGHSRILFRTTIPTGAITIVNVLHINGARGKNAQAKKTPTKVVPKATSARKACAVGPLKTNQALVARRANP